MESSLKGFNYQTQLVVNSKQITEKFHKRHDDLMKNIENYQGILDSRNSHFQKIFISNTYKTDVNNKIYLCYLLAKEVCDMIANKATGNKSFLFATTYIDRFCEMEKAIKLNNIKDSIPQTLKKIKVEATLNNCHVKTAQMWLKIVTISKFPKIANTYVASTLANKNILQLPKAEQNPYSATDIGKTFGVSSSMIRSCTNESQLKTKGYRKIFYEKSRYSHKDVEMWQYYDIVIPVFTKLLEMGVVA